MALLVFEKILLKL